jgi:hypothetical protein
LEAQPPNARINPPEDNCRTDKFTMRGKLIPVGFNELLGSSSDVSIHRAIWLYFAS